MSQRAPRQPVYRPKPLTMTVGVVLPRAVYQALSRGLPGVTVPDQIAAWCQREAHRLAAVQRTAARRRELAARQLPIPGIPS